MMTSEGESRRQPALVAGIDYYIENGRWVFTAVYHRRRGYCCQSGCRHCPYKSESTDASPTHQTEETPLD